MTPARRTALTVLLAVAFSAVGALAGAGLHWFVVQPSDDELLAVAREVDLAGVVPSSGPVVTGRWAPSFDRGLVVAEGRAEVNAPEVAADLEADGWTVDEVAERGAAQTVSASRGGVDIDVHLRGGEATVRLTRGDVVPSLAVAVLLGAVVGAVGGALLGRRARVTPAR